MFRISSLIPLLVLRLLLLLIMKNGNNKPHKLKNISMNIFVVRTRLDFRFVLRVWTVKELNGTVKEHEYIVQYSD